MSSGASLGHRVRELRIQTHLRQPFTQAGVGWSAERGERWLLPAGHFSQWQAGGGGLGSGNAPRGSNKQPEFTATADPRNQKGVHWLCQSPRIRSPSFSATGQGSVWVPGRPRGFWDSAPGLPSRVACGYDHGFWSQTAQGSNPAGEPTCCVTLSKCLYLSEPRAAHTQHRQPYLFRRFGGGGVIQQ